MHSGNFLPSASKQVPDVYSYIPAISGQEFWLKSVTYRIHNIHTVGLLEFFVTHNGVKQGRVASPVLFCIYIDDLLVQLAQSGVGCFIGFNFVGALAICRWYHADCADSICYASITFDLRYICRGVCSMLINLSSCISEHRTGIAARYDSVIGHNALVCCKWFDWSLTDFIHGTQSDTVTKQYILSATLFKQNNRFPMTIWTFRARVTRPSWALQHFNEWYDFAEIRDWKFNCVCLLPLTALFKLRTRVSARVRCRVC